MVISSVDISNYTGFLTQEKVDCLKANDIRYVVVRASLEAGKQRREIAQQQLQILNANGIETGVYLWMYPSESPEEIVRGTIDLIGPNPCRWFWIDAEEIDDKANPTFNADWLDRAIAEIRRQGKSPGIYTGWWWWNDPQYMNGSEAFKNIPLWTADYDKTPNLLQWHQYGGWSLTTIYGKQYMGNGQQALCGISCDLNVFVDDVLTPAPVVIPDIPQPPIITPEPQVTGSDIKWGLVGLVGTENWRQLATNADQLANATGQ